jgi:hypothetical protein
MPDTRLVPEEAIIHAIHWIRGEKVLLDQDLADLYGVDTRALVQAVKRNPDRFPDDFAIVLTPQEVAILRSQNVISRSWGGRRGSPLAFTEQGVAMLSSVLRSPRAVKINVEIIRVFVRLRRLLSTNVELAKKLEALEARYDRQFRVVFQAIRELMAPAISPSTQIGFRVEKPDVDRDG